MDKTEEKIDKWLENCNLETIGFSVTKEGTFDIQVDADSVMVSDILKLDRSLPNHTIRITTDNYAGESWLKISGVRHAEGD